MPLDLIEGVRSKSSEIVDLQHVHGPGCEHDLKDLPHEHSENCGHDVMSGLDGKEIQVLGDADSFSFAEADALHQHSLGCGHDVLADLFGKETHVLGDADNFSFADIAHQYEPEVALTESYPDKAVHAHDPGRDVIISLDDKENRISGDSDKFIFKAAQTFTESSSARDSANAIPFPLPEKQLEEAGRSSSDLNKSVIINLSAEKQEISVRDHEAGYYTHPELMKEDAGLARKDYSAAKVENHAIYELNKVPAMNSLQQADSANTPTAGRKNIEHAVNRENISFQEKDPEPQNLQKRFKSADGAFNSQVSSEPNTEKIVSAKPLILPKLSQNLKMVERICARFITENPTLYNHESVSRLSRIVDRLCMLKNSMVSGPTGRPASPQNLPVVYQPLRASNHDVSNLVLRQQQSISRSMQAVSAYIADNMNSISSTLNLIRQTVRQNYNSDLCQRLNEKSPVYEKIIESLNRDLLRLTDTYKNLPETNRMQAQSEPGSLAVKSSAVSSGLPEHLRFLKNSFKNASAMDSVRLDMLTVRALSVSSAKVINQHSFSDHIHDRQRMQRLIELQQLLREDSLISAQLLSELLGLLEESADEFFEKKGHKRTMKRQVGAALQNRAAKKSIKPQKPEKILPKNFKQSVNAKTNNLIKAATEKPSRSLDVVQSREEDDDASIYPAKE